MAATILDVPTVPASGPEDYKAELEKCQGLLKEMIQKTSSAPIMVRLAWHDSGTYAEGAGEWPSCGGANGSIRFVPEINHGANNGLVLALELLKPIKTECPKVTYADLFQLASAVGIEVSGGPKIPMRYGRAETDAPEQCPKEGNLPAAEPPFPAEASGPAKHLRDIFHRMGLSDKDIVALSGAHTLGRAHQSRSGVSCGKDSTKYTADGPGTKGGSSWTAEWLKFDNSYFVSIKSQTDKELLVLPTDACLFEDPSFKEWAEKYAEDQEAFFADYCESHKKLSELGSKFLFEVTI